MKLKQAEAKLTNAYRDYFVEQKALQAKDLRMAELENKVADLGGDVVQCIRAARLPTQEKMFK